LPSAVFGDVPFIVKWDMSGGNIYHSLHHKERASKRTNEFAVASSITVSKIKANVYTNTRTYTGDCTFELYGNTTSNDTTSASIGDLGIAVPASTTGDYSGDTEQTFSFDFNDSNGWADIRMINNGGSGSWTGSLIALVRAE
jgi:hypothetical protein